MSWSLPWPSGHEAEWISTQDEKTMRGRSQAKSSHPSVIGEQSLEGLA